MRRFLLLASLILSAAIGTAAQTTTVTGMVVDANNNVYFPGTASAYIVTKTGAQPAAGTTLTQTSPTTTGGNFSLTLTSNQSYIFTFCATPTLLTIPNTNPTPQQVCFNTLAIAVSGGAQNITSSLGTVTILGPKLTNGSGSILNCPTVGGVAFQNGTNNTLTCSPNLTYVDATPNQQFGVGCTPQSVDMSEICGISAIVGTVTGPATNNDLYAWQSNNFITINSPNTTSSKYIGSSSSFDAEGSGTFTDASAGQSGVTGSATLGAGGTNPSGTVALLVGVNGLAANESTAGTATTLMAFKAGPNSNAGTVVTNYGFYGGDQHGVGSNFNAVFFAPDQGTGAKDFAYYSGGGKSQLDILAVNSLTNTNVIYVAAPKYGAKFDGKVFYGNVSTISTNGTTINCSDCNFTSADVGKQFTITNGNGGVQANFTGVSLLASPSTATTIATIVSGTQITISQSAGVHSGSTLLMAYATNDDAALTAAETDWQAGPTCKTLALPQGLTATLKSHFTNPGNACNVGQEPQADFTAHIMGLGPGTTTIGFFPGFDFTTCTGGASATACWGGYKEATWQNLTFNGFAWSNTGAGAAHNLVEWGLGSQGTQVMCIGIGGADTNLTGYLFDEGVRMVMSTQDGCGNTGEAANGTIIKLYYMFSGDNLGAALQLNATSDVTDFGSDYGGQGGTKVIFFNGNNVRYDGESINLFACSSVANATAINVNNTTGGTLILNNARVNCTSTTSNGIFTNAASNKIYLEGNSQIGGTTAAVNDTAGLVFVDPTVSFVAGAITSLAPTCSQSAGNGTCATVAGSTNAKGTVRITAGTTTSTNPSFTMTFIGTYAGPSGAGPACTFQLANTGTGSWITAAPTSTGLPIITTASTASQLVTITTTVGLTSTNTYDVRYNCPAQ